MIGVQNNNKMQWIITRTVDMACKMITLIYISRCQKDSEPLIHTHYTGTIFSYKPFLWDHEYEAFDEISNWLVNLETGYNNIPRELLFARNQHSCHNYSNPSLELKTAEHSDAATDKQGEQFDS